uniref:Uncharacterized protein n=1 Tax=Candidatus Kentrum sp. MB TaxID=2138164 RepID=A0A451BGF7_9GAMM|nr:MAG: hypothetical protein BECKMB1821G_GA0114241_11328 [Candidatus Kentron sp. MB]VFK35762.1 MAG: hypothetical protein BECKMB1821I_GA0114274_11438 [Candidatus Kentron sp. MB]VFK77356.1 MAG: hypothetical protein BECKMB1821H_GA0114242_112710 [Candidatus Kentron sp. MB]
MKDEVLQELWEIKDELARESGYDIEALFKTLRTVQTSSTHPIVNLAVPKSTVEQTVGVGEEDRVNFDRA